MPGTQSGKNYKTEGAEAGKKYHEDSDILEMKQNIFIHLKRQKERNLLGLSY